MLIVFSYVVFDILPVIFVLQSSFLDAMITEKGINEEKLLESK